jgi:hypothetical protein
MQIHINERLMEQIEQYARDHGRDADLVVEEALLFFLQYCQTGELYFAPTDSDIYQQQWLLDELVQR